MNGHDLRLLRQQAGLGQAEMAQHMGLSHRQYQEVEGSGEPLRPMHVMAAGAASMALAIAKEDPGLLTLEALEAVITLAPMIRPQDRARLDFSGIRPILTEAESAQVRAVEATLGRQLTDAEVMTYLSQLKRAQADRSGGQVRLV